MSQPISLPAVPAGPAPGASPERAEFGVDASMALTNPQLPTRDQVIRMNALSLAISARPVLTDDNPDALLARSTRFEMYIRDGAS